MGGSPTSALRMASDVESRMLEFARRLIATPSLPGDEEAVSRLVADELRLLGYRDVERDEAGNVTAWFGHGPARLMFNGHLDHVPPGAMEAPYEPRVVDGSLRGRGSCDMKANVAAGAYAIAFLDAVDVKAGSYLFTADVQEETDSPAGIQALLARGLRADYGVSGESTGLDVHVGHRGKVQLDVVVAGRSSHAATPQAGLNAVYRAVPFLQAIERLAERLPSDPLFGPATVTVTRISSEPEEEVAVVPGTCTIRVDRRYLPGETPETCEQELAALVADVSASHGVPSRVRRVSIYPLMATDPDHELVALGLDAVRAVTGSEARVGTWRFGVNATWMSEAGIPTIGVGPGSEDFAHTDDEHVPVDEVVQASRIYAELIRRLCR